jgi:acetyltransferase-like isoleucine patch superfamily enzyme
MRKLFIVLISRIYDKLIVDPNIPTSYILASFLRMGLGLIHGLIFYRRKIVIGRNSKIRCLKKLQLHGGLVRIGENCELDCLSEKGLALGRSFKLGSSSKIMCTGSIQNIGKGVRIGDFVGIGEFAYIGGAGGVTIGNNCIIGQYFSVHPENHKFARVDKKIKDQGTTRVGINIGKNCWIGSKVTILDAAKIGDNCVIAAGSVVRDEFPNDCVIAGVPAKVISYRS